MVQVSGEHVPRMCKDLDSFPSTDQERGRQSPFGADERLGEEMMKDVVEGLVCRRKQARGVYSSWRNDTCPWG